MAESWRRVLEVADRARPGLAALVTRALAEAQSPGAVRAVRAALRRGDYAGAELAAAAALKGALAAVEARLARDLHALLGAGARVGGPARLAGRFDVLNPRAVEWARTRSAALVTGLVAGQRQALRELTRRVVSGDLTVDAAARLVAGVVGLDGRRAAALAAFAARERGALGPRVREAGRARVERRVARYAERLRRQRARVIAHTEALAATNHGQLEAWRQAQERGLLRGTAGLKVWVVTPDDQLCTWCLPLGGAERRLGEPFASGRFSVQAPPLHPNCRCTLRLSTRPAVGPRPVPPPQPPPVVAPPEPEPERPRFEPAPVGTVPLYHPKPTVQLPADDLALLRALSAEGAELRYGAHAAPAELAAAWSPEQLGYSLADNFSALARGGAAGGAEVPLAEVRWAARSPGWVASHLNTYPNERLRLIRLRDGYLAVSGEQQAVAAWRLGAERVVAEVLDVRPWEAARLADARATAVLARDLASPAGQATAQELALARASRDALSARYWAERERVAQLVAARTGSDVEDLYRDMDRLLALAGPDGATLARLHGERLAAVARVTALLEAKTPAEAASEAAWGALAPGPDLAHTVVGSGTNPAVAAGADWLRLRGLTNAPVGRLGIEVEVRARRVRAFAETTRRRIVVHAMDTREVVVHELLHVFEAEDPVLRRAVREYFARRTAGLKTRRLNKILPGMGYKNHEVAYDMLKAGRSRAHPYYWKSYVQGDTELLSLGVQAMMSPQLRAELAREDPDLYEFVVRAVRYLRTGVWG